MSLKEEAVRYFYQTFCSSSQSSSIDFTDNGTSQGGARWLVYSR